MLSARVDVDGRIVATAGAQRVPWWSVTKTALATAALTLVARGALALDTPVAGQSYTLRHLLQHRAGVPDYGSLPAYRDAVRRGERAWEPAKLLARVGADRLDFVSGQGWRYSNVGYFLVRGMIEAATGLDLEMALRRLVFDALGLASVHLVTTATELAATAWGNGRGYDPRWVYHGLLAGTPTDAALFVHRLMSGAILPVPLLAEMRARHPIGGPLQGRPWQSTGYGLGLMIGEMASAGPAAGHSGGGPGSVSAVYHFAERRAPCTVAAFTQAEDEAVAEFEAARLAGPA